MIYKHSVYIYGIDKKLKDIKAFDTLEDCFNFISEQNRLYTMNVKLKETKAQEKINQLEFDLF